MTRKERGLCSAASGPRGRGSPGIQTWCAALASSRRGCLSPFFPGAPGLSGPSASPDSHGSRQAGSRAGFHDPRSGEKSVPRLHTAPPDGTGAQRLLSPQVRNGDSPKPFVLKGLRIQDTSGLGAPIPVGVVRAEFSIPLVREIAGPAHLHWLMGTCVGAARAQVWAGGL